MAHSTMCAVLNIEGILHCMQLNCKHSLSVLVRKSNGLSYRFLANATTQTLLIFPKTVQSFLIFPSKDC